MSLSRSPEKKLTQGSGLNKSLSKPVLGGHRNSSSSISDRSSTLCTENSVSEKLLTTSSIRDQALRKPISLIILEKYFLDLCQSVSSRNSIEISLLKKIDTMKEVLKDCLIALPDIQLEVYVMMSTALKDVQMIKDTKEDVLIPRLVKNLGTILMRINENKFRNRTEKEKVDKKGEVIEEEVEDLEKELDVRISRVTARVLNIWKKIVSPQKEAEVICYCFLLLYSEIDRSIKVSSVIKSQFDKPTDIMKTYLNNPGYVVTIIRHTKDYIQRELISIPIIRKIFSFLEKITMERIRNCDKTLTGYVLYELVFYSVMYYAHLYKEKTNSDLFDRKISLKSKKNPNENIVFCTEGDNLDDFFPEIPKETVLLTPNDKNQRSSSQPPVRERKVETPMKKTPSGLSSLKEKPNKKTQKQEKDKEFVENLKKKFAQDTEKNDAMKIPESLLSASGLTPINERKLNSSPKRSTIK